MAATEKELRQELSEERARLADAVDQLRDEIGEAADVSGKLQARLPLAAGVAFALGFVKAGGVGATARLLARRSRDGDEKAAVGRFRVVDRG
jgi:hypothetical protein